MTLLAAFGVLLSRLSAADQIVIGTDAANRNRAELEGLIGFFINLLPLRLDLSGNPGFRELLQRVRAKTLSAYAHTEVPFDKLVEDVRPERNAAYNPIVQVLFVMQNVPRPARELAGLAVEYFELPVTRSKFDLGVFATETPDGLVMHWLYSCDLFDSGSIRRMARQFEAVLANAVAAPETRVNALPLVRADTGEAGKERKQAQLRKLMTAVRE
jgi:non-ribosomal peptide synthetase component F